MITPEQCKAARELLRWSIKELSKKSRSTVETIGLFEESSPGSRRFTANKLQETFEAAGVEFVVDDDDAKMVRLRRVEHP